MKKIIKKFIGITVVGILILNPIFVFADEEIVIETDTTNSSEEVVTDSNDSGLETSTVEDNTETQGIIEENDNSTTTEEIITEPEINLATTTEELTETSSFSSESTSSTTQGVRVIVRHGENIVFDDVVDLPETPNIDVTDNTGTARSIPSSSVLSLVSIADALSEELNISDLAYYSSFDSFIINCINIASLGSNECYNWQYVVNDTYPYVGVDDVSVSNGDTIYLYFGYSKRIVVPDVATTTNTTFKIEAQRYSYSDNTWIPIDGSVVGATLPDPSNPWSPIEVATSTTDSLGQSSFSLIATSTYYFGFKDDYYYPTWSYDIVDFVATSSATSTDSTSTTTESNTNNSGGGGGGISHNKPNLETLLTFLDSKQKTDGSFGADLYTDWASIAYGASTGHDDAKNKLREFLKTDSLDGSAVTDYERRVMAMLALGLNPYSDGPIDYISKTVSSFDGNQIGEAGLFNDDVFGILVLRNVGFEADEDIIKKAGEVVLNNISNINDPDTAGATLQALSLISNSGADSAKANLSQAVIASQNNDGSFGNVDPVSSTAWFVLGLYALENNPETILKSGNNSFDYLWSKQQSDGGMKDATETTDNRIWATSYAVPAVSGKTWDTILQNVSKQNTVINNTVGGEIVGVASSTSATSTIISFASTTTPEIKNIISNNTEEDEFVGDVLGAEDSKKIEDSLTASTTLPIKNTELVAGVSSVALPKELYSKLLIIIGLILAGFGTFRIMRV